jgi:serine/threonine protein kinase
MSDFAHLALGEVFAGRYQVERLIAAGGMGAVYASVHTSTLRKVALKVMRPEIVADPGARQRFAKEAQVSARLESPNVVDVLDAGIDPATGIPFFAMELLVGKELGELLKERGRLQPQEVFTYLTQAARALDKAHAIGIVHRDLKPENLFLVVREGEAPMIKVLDFGIARILEGATHAATMAGGTPLYMAPEQTSRSSSIGPHTDVWALALTAYTLLVGRPYWKGGDSLMQLYGEVLTAQLDSPVARAAEVGVHLPPTLDAWFYRCVNRDPSMRMPRAGECIKQLGEVFGFSATPTPQQFVVPTAHSLPSDPGPQTSPVPPTPYVAAGYGAPPSVPTAYAPVPTPAAAYGAPPATTAYGAPPPAYGAPPTPYGAPVIPPHIPALAADARPSGRSGGGVPMPALVALGVVAVGAIGFGVFTALRSSSSGGGETTTTIQTPPDNTKTVDDDEDGKKKKDKGKDKDKQAESEPTDKADPKPLGTTSDPTPAPTPTPTPTIVKPPTPVATPTIVKPKTPPPPKQNCSPGTVNAMGRCDCPAGFRSVGPSGSARCVPDDPDDE